MLSWGTLIEAPDGAVPEVSYLRSLCSACSHHPDFEVVGWTRVALSIGGYSDYLMVDARTGAPGRNPVGIRSIERLAIGSQPQWAFPLDVRALRKDFPRVLHLNGVGANEPPSICMYDDTWAAVQRTWTAHRYLSRILWWLQETALGRLHAPDQPLEPLFYASGVRVILPHALRFMGATKPVGLTLEEVSGGAGSQIVRGRISDKPLSPHSVGVASDYLFVDVPLASAAIMRTWPSNLSELDASFVAMGSELIAPLRRVISNLVDGEGLKKATVGSQKTTLVLLHIPRTQGDGVDTSELRAFLIGQDLRSLGHGCGALFDGGDGLLYVDRPLTADRESQRHVAALEACRQIAVAPAEILFELDQDGARAFSGIDRTTAEFHGLLVGVGALGSLLADIWAREGWGMWAYVDDDILLPHNVVRHLGHNDMLGVPKVHIARLVAGFDGAEGTRHNAAHRAAFSKPYTAELACSVEASQLIVDASTTLYVGRDAMDDDSLPRMASVFLTPTGLSSVLLIDSADRAVRLGHLEAQYYRAILRSDWGARHLQSHQGSLRAGGGCRDISVTLSGELVHLHGGLLARYVRSCRDQPDARIRVWTLDEVTGAIRAEDIPVAASRTKALSDWTITWDDEIEERVFALREAQLPSETGGILLGYVDHKLKKLYVVDACPAPADSESDPSGFTRGTDGVLSDIKAVNQRSGGIVDYIGEWHSHPKEHSATPSTPDWLLLGYLAELRGKEGEPTLMMIAGHEEISFSFAPASELCS